MAIACGDDMSPAALGEMIVTSGYTVPTYWDQVSAEDCPKIILRHWSSSDENGNVFSCIQTITVVDEQAPVITIAPSYVSDCAEPVGLPYSVADCDPNSTVTIVWGTVTQGETIPCNPGSFRTQTQGGWGAEPSGNNQGTYLYAHFANAFPDGLTIGCNNTLTLTAPEAITAFLPSGTTPVALPAGQMVNPGEAYQNVLAGQLVAATLNMGFDLYYEDFGTATQWMGDLTIESGTFSGMTMSQLMVIANQVIGGCNNDYSFPQVNEALTSFNQNYDNGTVNNNFLECDEEIGGCEFEQPYTITATDNCGNTSSASGTIAIVDNSAPVFVDAVIEITITCDQWPVDTLQVEDPCGFTPVTVSFVDSEFSGACHPSIERIYTASDACGNTVTFTQYIFIIDTTPPAISGLEQVVSVQCSDEVVMENPDITDNCNEEVSVVYTANSETQQCSEIITRHWIATDLCGNTSSFTQVIIVSDTEAPTFGFVPANLELACGSTLPTSAASATDNCAQVEIIQTDVWQNSPGTCQQVLRTFRAIDACGNETMATQIISFVDTVNPVFSTLPQNYSGSCNALTPAPVLTATDNCDNAVEVFFAQTTQATGCTSTIHRIWSAVDNCGNTAFHEQTVTITDNEGPVFSANPVVTISCNQLPGLSISATDNCTGLVVIGYSDFLLSIGCAFDIARTWTATDACGNSSQFEQLIHVADNQPPVFAYVPPSFNISCGNPPAVQNPVVTDNCTMNVIPVLMQVTTGSGCSYTITRTWTATDNCGNTSTASQVITVSDNVATVFAGVPPSISISCTQVPAAPVVTAMDNCAGQMDVTFEETSSGEGCNYQVIRTWTAIDPCGNQVTASQNIFSNDNTPPAWANVPASITLSCVAAVPPVGSPTATDNCSGVANTFFFEFTESTPCGSIIHRNWQAIDGCGNIGMATQNITVTDNTAPTLVNTPSPIVEVTCDNIPPVALVSATDACGDVSIAFSEQIILSGCPYTLRRTWTATDECGNASAFIQNIYVTDSTAPVLMNVPSNATITCGSEIPAATLLATDNCTPVLSVEMTESITWEGCTQTISRIFSTYDLCGNVATATQVITVTDDEAPVLSGMPEDIEVSCGDIPAAEVLTAFDACQGEVDVIYVEQAIELDSILTCELTTAQAFFGNIALWLPGLDGVSVNYTFTQNNGSFTVDHANGTAHITGEVQNTTNTEQRWLIDFYLSSERDWTEWSALGRSYKDDLDMAGDNYLDWAFYELDPSSQLIGTGQLEGSVLNITHAPSTYYYGFQVGVGANNRNTEYGMSGWIYYSGTVNYNPVAGHGDFYSENDCCPEQQIVRQWTAEDCAGNITIHTQNIFVSGEAPAFIMMQVVDAPVIRVSQTVAESFMITYTVPQDSQVSIDLFSTSGQSLANLYDGSAMANTAYTIEIPATNFDNGMYFVRLSDSKSNVTAPVLMMR